MRRIISATIVTVGLVAMATAPAWAACYTERITVGGRTLFCQTCCTAGGVCQTRCH